MPKICSAMRRGDSQHFHQLCRPLWTTPPHQTLRDTVRGDLGHCNDLLGNPAGPRARKNSRTVVHHLRHRIVEKRHQGTATTIWSTVCRRTRSTTFGGSGSFRTPGHFPPELAVFCARRPDVRTRPHITTVMRGHSELCRDGHPLVSPPRAEPSLPPPFCGSSDATNIHVDRLGQGKKG